MDTIDLDQHFADLEERCAKLPAQDRERALDGFAQVLTPCELPREPDGERLARHRAEPDVRDRAQERLTGHATMSGTLTLGSVKKSPEHREGLRRVKAWTRERFKLPDDTAILVAEIACGVPGCPPLETVVAFWTEGERRHHYKVFKPVADVVSDDLPPTWMRDRLVEAEVFGCPCC